MTIATIAAGIGTLLAGCATDNIGTQDAGAALPQAQYQILGKTRYDQAWIDKTIEGEIAAFKFKRPLRRPASLDAKPTAQKVTVTPAVAPPLPLIAPTQPAVVSVAPVKRSVTQQLRERIDALNAKVRKLEKK